MLKPAETATSRTMATIQQDSAIELGEMMVLVESLAAGGEGVARLEDGRVVFIRGACPGDRVEIELVTEKKRWAAGEIRAIIEPSPDRVEPPCPYFGACGGCQWQHVAYPVQLSSKRQIVADALERIGGITGDGVVEECVASPRLYGYRNKVELVRVPGDRFELGFHRIASDDVLAIDRCLLLPDTQAGAPGRLAGALRFASGAGDLGIVRVAFRVAENTQDIEVALWTAPSGFPRQVVSSTLTDSVKASSVVRVLAKDARERRTPSVEVLGGRGYWRERLREFEFAVSAPSFFQVNTSAAELLVDIAMTALAADGSDSVIDVFSGVGTFTLPLARVASTVVAVEGAGSAVRDLRRNLESAGLSAAVEPGDAVRVLERASHADAVVVDPPRAGLSPGLVDSLARIGPSRLVYVSCDPATLARDARALADAGFSLASAVPIDLFPQTFHVETVALFVTRPRHDGYTSFPTSGKSVT